MDPTKDVLIFYHAIDVDNTSELPEIVLEVAKEVKQVKDLVIGKYMIDYNENENLTFENLPDMRFYPKENKKDFISVPMDESDEVGA